MSNRLFQGIVHQMKDAIDRTIGVIDETSVVIACSELGKIGEVNESVNSETLTDLSAAMQSMIMQYLFRVPMSMLRSMLSFCRFLLQASSSIMTKSMIVQTLLRMLFLTTFFRVTFTLKQESFTLTARFPVCVCLLKLFQKQMFPLMI